MSGTQTIAEQRRDRVIEDSIRDQRPSVLTLKTDRGWRTYRSRFLSGSRPNGTVVLKVDAQDDSSTVSLPAPGESLGVSFRSGHMKCVFSSVLEGVRTDNDGPIITLRWPSEVQRLQRRVYERVEPQDGNVVAVRFWLHEPVASPPGAEPAVRYGQLEDLSAGGMRVQTADAEGIQSGCGYRCAFMPKARGPSLVVDATLRHQEATERGRVSLGFQFVGLETTVEGRKTLNSLVKILMHFQRARDRLRKPRSPASGLEPRPKTS